MGFKQRLCFLCYLLRGTIKAMELPNFNDETDLQPLRRALQAAQKEIVFLRKQLANLNLNHAYLPAAFSGAPLELRVAVKAAGLSLWDWDIIDNRVTLAPAWGDTTETSVEPVWQTIEDLKASVHPEDVDRVRQHLADFLQGKRDRYAIEHRMRSNDAWIWILSMGLASEYDVSGRIIRMVGANTNITERKEIERQLLQAQTRAEQASSAKSEFLANMSHEVRTPLNAIMGLARLLHKTPLDKQQSDYLQLMDNSATALLALLNDVLDLSKIEAGKIVIEQVRFNIFDWLEKTVSPFTMQAQEKGLLVDLDIANDVPQYLMGDPGRLRQVITNLLSNAVKFTPKGGIRIKVWTDPDQTGVPDGYTQILFEIRDTGIGMNAEQLKKIFEPFTQADASTTRRFGGTGLGLAISLQLVNMMKGQIRVASLPDKGSAFRFSSLFVVASTQVTELTVSAMLSVQSLDNLRVLVAEDHPINQMLIKKLLQELGCHTVMAGNGQEAIDCWRSGGIDLILMDVQMPIMGGEEAAGKIRLEEKIRGGHTPIVALTAHALAGDKEKYLGCGMDAYATKPVSPDSLIKAMHDALNADEPFVEEYLPAFDFEIKNF